MAELTLDTIGGCDESVEFGDVERQPRLRIAPPPRLSRGALCGIE